MIKETTENLYPFIVSQLPKKYRAVILRRTFFTQYTVLIIDKGPRHNLSINYNDITEDFLINLQKPCGNGSEVIIHKYA